MVDLPIWTAAGAILALSVLGGYAVSQNTNHKARGMIGTADAPIAHDIVALLSEPPSSKLAQLPAEDLGGYQSRCSQEWTKRGVPDNAQISFCVRRDRQGYLDLIALLKQYGGYSWMQGTLDNVQAEQTKRGARDDTQFEFEMSRQVDAFLNLQYALKHSELKTPEANDCLVKWSVNSINWWMVEFCYKEKMGLD